MNREYIQTLSPEDQKRLSHYQPQTGDTPKYVEVALGKPSRSSVEAGILRYEYDNFEVKYGVGDRSGLPIRQEDTLVDLILHFRDGKLYTYQMPSTVVRTRNSGNGRRSEEIVVWTERRD